MCYMPSKLGINNAFKTIGFTGLFSEEPSQKLMKRLKIMYKKVLRVKILKKKNLPTFKDNVFSFQTSISLRKLSII